MRTLTSKVAGVTYENRQEVIAQLRGNEPCRIVPEPDNKYDKNALAVHVAVAPGQVAHVGYLPRELAAQVAPWLEEEAVMAELLEITGGFETSEGYTASYGLRIRVEIPDERDLETSGDFEL